MVQKERKKSTLHTMTMAKTKGRKKKGRGGESLLRMHTYIKLLTRESSEVANKNDKKKPKGNPPPPLFCFFSKLAAYKDAVAPNTRKTSEREREEK